LTVLLVILLVVALSALTILLWSLRAPRRVPPAEHRFTPHFDDPPTQNPLEGEYRWRPGAWGDGTQRWDPFDPEASRRQRVRASRRPRRRAPRDDLYALLGVEAGASDRDIERAYRRRVAEWHPDRFHGDPAAQKDAERRLRQLNAAMDVLRDPIRRARYDAGR